MSTDAAPLPRATDGWRRRFLLLMADPSVGYASGLVAELARQHVDVRLCPGAVDALLLTGTIRPDGIVVAANLPDISSSAFVRAVATHTDIPTVVSIGPEEGDRADAVLAAGAAACIARPYRLPELILILRSIRPETIGTLDPVLECGGLCLDPATHEVRLYGRPVRLPLREFDLLRYFMVHTGRVVTREQIYETVWHGPAEASNTLNVHIRRLRQRLGDHEREGRIIVTVRGLGYRFVPPPASPPPPSSPSSNT